jgi:predicted GTPase
MNLVDTPGTNVILQRQQQLTEEYVPRADLILFVLSSDRPLTDSEVRIVFVLLCLTFTYLIL